jgi:hypothetical protein
MIWLRYRFDSLQSFTRHLRLGNGLFVPVRALRGTRAGVEVVWPDCTDPLLLHGRVRERARDGAWVDLPPMFIPGPLAESRADRRIPCDLFVEVKPAGGAPYVCRALDLSPRGVRLATGSLEAGIAGDELSVSLLGPEPIELAARLAWSAAREAGLRFLESSPTLDALIASADSHWEVLNHATDCFCGRAVLRTG